MTRTGKCYTPKKTKDFESMVGSYALSHMKKNNISIMSGPVYVDAVFHMKVPNSWSLKKKAKAICGDILPCVTPDIDNLVKSLLDALQGVLFYNDKQVVRCVSEKIYSERDEIEVDVYENHVF